MTASIEECEQIVHGPETSLKFMMAETVPTAFSLHQEVQRTNRAKSSGASHRRTWRAGQNIERAIPMHTPHVISRCWGWSMLPNILLRSGDQQRLAEVEQPFYVSPHIKTPTCHFIWHSSTPPHIAGRRRLRHEETGGPDRSEGAHPPPKPRPGSTSPCPTTPTPARSDQPLHHRIQDAGIFPSSRRRAWRPPAPGARLCLALVRRAWPTPRRQLMRLYAPNRQQGGAIVRLPTSPDGIGPGAYRSALRRSTIANSRHARKPVTHEWVYESARPSSSATSSRATTSRSAS